MTYNREGIAVDIFAGRDVFRYSSRRFQREEINEDGNTVVIRYLPKIISFNIPSSDISLDGGLSKTSVPISVSEDCKRVLKSIEGESYETLRVKIYYFDSNNNIKFSVVGYVNEVDRSRGELDMTVRVDNQSESLKLLKRFSFDTFQKFEVLRPRAVNLSSSFNANTSCPWQVFKTSYRSTTLDKQVFRRLNTLTSIRDWGVEKIYNNPPGGLPEGGEALAIKLSLNGLNLYDKYVEKDVFFVKLTVLEIGYDYIFTYDGVTYNYVSVSGDTSKDILEDFATQLTTAGFPSEYLESEDRLYIEGDPTLLTIQPIPAEFAFEMGYLTLFFDPNTPGSTKRLAKVSANLFQTAAINSSTGNPFKPSEASLNYYVAVVGSSEAQGQQERVAYLYCLKGKMYHPAIDAFFDLDDDNYYLSGIPTEEYPNPGGTPALVSFAGFDASVTTSALLLEKYGVQNQHLAGEVVAPYNSFDKVYVDANGLSVFDIDDPDLGSGFINFEGKIDLGAGKEYLTFHRYKMSNIYTAIYDDNKNNGTVFDEVFELEIHNRNVLVDDAHVYYANVLQGLFELRSGDPQVDSNCILGEYNAVVNYMDVHLEGLTTNDVSVLSTDQEARSFLKSRYRGLRVDMLENLGDFSQVIQSATQNVSGELTREQIKKVNANLINNFEGKFAVCFDSEIVVENFEPFERLYFDTVILSNFDRKWIQADFLESGNERDPSEIEYNNTLKDGVNNYFVNYLTFKPTRVSALDYSNNWSEDQALDFFLTGSYRVIHDPVPENEQDLGSNFPIVYGSVKNVPLLQCVSKKSYTSEYATAGDDYYVYASHPCSINEAEDIEISVYNSEDPDYEDDPSLKANLKYIAIQNPFPKVIEGHHIVEEVVTGVPKIKTVGELINPYHKLLERNTSEGYNVFGVQLLGGLWDFRAGQFDKRYPIRNGVGNSTLVGSFSGYVDKLGVFTQQPGSVVQHPCDIIHHFVATYGSEPYNTDYLDLDNLNEIKSLTPRYRASCFIQENVAVIDFVEDMCRQFGFLASEVEGKLKISFVDSDLVRNEKVVSDNKNLLEVVSESTDGYTDVYNEVIVNYDFNYVDNNYNRNIFLNYKNNRYCSKANSAKIGKKSFTLNAKFINSFSIANLVALYYAKLLCRRQKLLQFNVLKDDVYRVGDFISLTSKEAEVTNQSCFVVSSKEELNYYSLEVVVFL